MVEAIGESCVRGVRSGGVGSGGVRCGGVRCVGVRSGGVRSGGVRSGGVRSGGVKSGGVRRICPLPQLVRAALMHLLEGGGGAVQSILAGMVFVDK